MVGFARATLTCSGGKVRFSSGKTTYAWNANEWEMCLKESMTSVLTMPRKDGAPSGILLYRGQFIRAAIGTPLEDLDRLFKVESTFPAVVEPTPPPRPNLPLLEMLPSLSEQQGWLLALPFVQALADTYDESPEVILYGVRAEAIQTAKRFVQRHVFQEEISRYIPQDVKIAVAVRDGGRCTAQEADGSRCAKRSELHFDHRFIPFHYGGPQSPWNLTLHCGPHNIGKGASMPHLHALATWLVGMWR